MGTEVFRQSDVIRNNSSPAGTGINIGGTNICSNKFYGNSGSVITTGGSATNGSRIYNNEFLNNSSDTNSVVSVSSSNSNIYNNDFLNNTGTSCLLMSGSPLQPVVTQNNFINPGVQYEVNNQIVFAPGANITVSNNYWGTTDTAYIDSVINDFFDDANLSVALYPPVLSAPAFIDTNSTCLSTVCSSISVSGTVVNPSCFGGNNGSINITVANGVTPYSYVWSTGATNEDRSNLSSGNYSVTVFDANGCSGTRSFTLTQPSAVVVTGVFTNASCNTGGSINITVSGGTAPYTYNWGNGIITEDRTGLNPGNYVVTVMDNRSCAAVKSFAITQLAGPIISGVVTNASCFGACDGAINLSVVGIQPFTYNWGNGFGTVEDTSGLCAGSYNVTVADFSNCGIAATFTVTSPAELNITTSITTDVTCFGYSDGAALASASGGTPPYSFLWSDGQITYAATALSAGVHNVTVTDNLGCTDTASVNIPDGVNVHVGVIGGLSIAETNQLSVYIVTANFNYSYAWSVVNGTILSGQGTNSLEVVWNSVGQGFLQLLVSQQGCSDTISKTVTVVDATGSGPYVSGVVTNASCFGACDGAINLSVTGIPPFTFNWGNGFGTTEDTSGLCAGSYSVAVADSGNRVAFATFTVTSPPEIHVGVIIGLNTALTNQNYVYSVNGNLNYAYDWSVTNGTIVSGQGTNGIEVGWDSAGQGVVQLIISEQGCSDTISKTVTVLDATGTTGPYVSGVVTDASCVGRCDGAINLTVTGIPPFIYNWGNGFGTNKDTSGLCTGTYVVTVGDSMNRTVSTAFSITTLSEITSIIGITENVSCFGYSDGAAKIIASGGIPPYSFLWSDGQTAEAPTNFHAGNYSVTVTDSLGCTAHTSISIQEGPLVFVGVIIGFNTAEINQPAVYSVNANLGNTYDWSISKGTIVSGQGTNSIEVRWDSAATGIVQVIVREQGCADTVSKTITLVNSATGIVDIGLNSIELFPNPTNGTFTLRGISSANWRMESLNLKLFDAMGKQVLHQTFESNQLTRGVTIDLAPMNQGVYFLRIQADKGTRVMKVVRN